MFKYLHNNTIKKTKQIVLQNIIIGGPGEPRIKDTKPSVRAKNSESVPLEDQSGQSGIVTSTAHEYLLEQDKTLHSHPYPLI